MAGAAGAQHPGCWSHPGAGGQTEGLQVQGVGKVNSQSIWEEGNLRSSWQADCGPDSGGERENPGDGAEVSRRGRLEFVGSPQHHRHHPADRLSQDRAQTEGPTGGLSLHHCQEGYRPTKTLR